MNEFKIEYQPEYSSLKYKIYRKEYRWFGLRWSWEGIATFDSLEKAEEELKTLKSYPRYYEF